MLLNNITWVMIAACGCVDFRGNEIIFDASLRNRGDKTEVDVYGSSFGRIESYVCINIRGRWFVWNMATDGVSHEPTPSEDRKQKKKKEPSKLDV